MAKFSLDFLFNIGTVKLGLGNMQKLLAALQHPEDLKNIVHIAGTNGKGSTLITLEKLLISSGYKVASMISPHVIKLNERFRYQSLLISDSELSSLVDKIMQVCGISEHNIDQPDSWKLRVTFFEAQTAMFFLWAQLKKPDYVLLEVGLGGSFDSTNVVFPRMSLITHISKDHQNYLGNRLSMIVAAKLGIVKPAADCFIGRQSQHVKKIIKQHKNADQFLFFGEDYGYRPKFNTGKCFFFKNLTPKDRLYTLAIKRISLLGNHQWENTALALAAYLRLVNNNNRLNSALINQALGDVQWLGRLQYIAQQPKILLDAAHNQSGIQALFKYISANYAGKKILLVIAWMKDKNLDKCLPLVNNFLLKVQPVVLDNPRALPAEKVWQQLKTKKFKLFKPIFLPALVQNIRRQTYQEFDLILISGSIFLLGDFLAEFNA